MGAECTCSKNQVSKLDDIQYNPDVKEQKQTQSQHSYFTGKFDAEDKKSQIHINNNGCSEENKFFQTEDDDQLQCQQYNKSNKKIEKKIAQVFLPGKQMDENKDNISFFIKQLNNNQSSLVIKTLKSHFILSQLSSEQITYILKQMKFCKAKRGDYIFMQNDPSFSYYVIIQGRCKVYIDKYYKRTLQPGSSFGDLGIIYNAPRSATILADKDCILAQLNAKTFKKFVNDLNTIHEKQNKICLQNLQFYKSLTQPQKDTLAANCISQFYKAGQIIFNKGDAANAFYIVQDGVVTVVQKNLFLKAGESVGVNAVIGKANAIRSNTLKAATNCRVLSITRDIIVTNLGDSVNNILRKNLVLKILKQSDIWDMYSKQQWIESINSLTTTFFNKGEIIFSKNTIINVSTVNVILKSDARSTSNPKSMFYIANSIIQQFKVLKRQEIKFQQDFIVNEEAELIQFSLTLKQNQKKKNKQNIGQTKNLTQSNQNNYQASSIASNNRALDLKDFIVIRKLRSGNFGKVYACYNKITKLKYAIKVMDKQRLGQLNALEYVIKQEQLMRTIPQYPFIVKYYCKFQQKNLIMLVMELLQGEDLFDTVNSRLPLKYNEYRFIICQIIIVLEYLHKNKVIYRDLKPENIVVNQDGYITLVDFGTAKKLTIESRFRTSTIIGTPHYMAPQIVIGKGYTFLSDWWSLGIMIYVMACGKLPYGDSIEDPFTVYQQLLRNELIFPPNINIATQQVINKLLEKSMHKRLKNGLIKLKKMEFFDKIIWDKIISKQYPSCIFHTSTAVIRTQQILKILKRKKLQPALQVFIKDKWHK